VVQWLTMMLDPELEKELSEHVDRIFHLNADLGETRDAELVKELLTIRLLAPLDIRLDSPEASPVTLVPVPETVDRPKLQELCRAQLLACLQGWFCKSLPCKTATFVRQNHSPFDRVYEVGRMLGKGTFGETYEVTHRASGEERICKKIHKTQANMSINEILQEIQNMACLDHPNIIQMYEYFDEAEYIIQIQDYARGGELWDRLEVSGNFSDFGEAEVRIIMKQMMKALAFMHDEECELHPCYLHKDLKPQNIMFCEPESAESKSLTIKLIDFGLCETFVKDQEMVAQAAGGGSIPWMAPEVSRGKYREKADIFSAGVIFFNMVTGEFPWDAITDPQKTKEKIPYNVSCKSDFSDQCLTLVDSMLRKDPEKRPSASEVLADPWFKVADHAPTLSVGVVQALRAYVTCSRLRRALLYLTTLQCSFVHIDELRQIFTHFDQMNRGVLSSSDLKYVLLACGLPALSTEQVINGLDMDGSGSVEWTEFCAGANCLAVYRVPKFVDSTFAFLDVDHDGYIDMDDILGAFKPAMDHHKDDWQETLETEWPGLADGEPRCNKEQFRAYMGQSMHIIPGQNLSARWS